MHDPRLPPGERLYAVGDLHGCHDLFARLIRLIRRDSEARPPARVRIVLLGDMIDRGPEPARLVEQCMALAQADADFVVLRGNHEQAMLHALGGNLEGLGSWLGFGGDATLRDWGVPEPLLAGDDLPALLLEARMRVPERVVAWLRGLPLTLRAGDYLFVHAGIRPGRPLPLQSATDLLWIGEPFLDSAADHGCVVVHGHTICGDAPDVRANRIGIDAGAYETGRLIALGIEGHARWTVEAEQPPARRAVWPAALDPAWSAAR